MVLISFGIVRARFYLHLSSSRMKLESIQYPQTLLEENYLSDREEIDLVRSFCGSRRTEYFFKLFAKATQFYFNHFSIHFATMKDEAKS